MKKSAVKSVKENDQFPLASEEISLIAELGFMAATAGFVVPAIRIFQGLLVLRVEHSFPFIGLAVARLYVGAFNDAVRVLREATDVVLHGREEIQLYLGLALHLANQPTEAVRVLSALLECGSLDADQQPLAESVLAQIEGSTKRLTWPSPARVIDIHESANSSH
jgi:hypothetical protein